MRRAILSCVALCALTMACNTGERARSDVVLRWFGTEFALGYGKVYPETGQLRFVFATSPIACEGPPAKDAATFDLSLPAGPDDDFFSGKRVGARLSSVSTDPRYPFDMTVLPARDVAVELSAFKVAKGQRLHGTIRGASMAGRHGATGPAEVKGSFELEICGPPIAADDDAAKTTAHPARADGVFFTPKKALVRLRVDPDGAPDIRSIDVVDSDVFCGDALHGVTLEDFGGGDPSLRSPQVTRVARGGSSFGSEKRIGWARLEGDLRVGATMKLVASVKAETTGDDYVTGEVPASVCVYESPREPHDPAPVVAIEAAVDDHALPIRYGVAHASSLGLVIDLVTKPVACNDTHSVAFGHMEGVRVRLGPGPGAKFFAGSTIATTLQFASSSLPHDTKSGQVGGVVRADSPFVTVTLEPFELREYARLRGTLRAAAAGFLRSKNEKFPVPPLWWTARAEGEFDVEVCPMQSGEGDVRKLVAGQPDHVPDAPAAGGAIAVLANTGVTAIERIVFTKSPTKSCKPEDIATVVWLPSGADALHHFTGVPQPINSDVAGARGWIEFDRLSFKPGDTISGRVSDAPVSGTFTATVCAPQP